MAYLGVESPWGFRLPSSEFNEDYFYGVRSGYKTGYTWKAVGPLLLSQFREVMLHSQYKSGRWLDAGCAKGFLLKIASQHGWKPYGFDVSAYAIRKARKNCPKANLFVLNAENKLPFGDGFFEVITALELIEHLKEPENFLKEAYRMLKPNGLLFITTPNVASLFNSRAVRGVYRSLGYTTPFDDETHVFYFDSELITKTLKRYKFSKVKIKYSWNSGRINLHLPRRFGWTLQAFAYR